MEKKPFKKEKFQEEIQQKVSQFIRKDLGDKRLVFVSITKVELNDDFSVATIYWDTFETRARGDVKKAIDGATGKLRHYLATNLTTRQIPQLNFIYDSQYEAEKHITDLLEEERKRFPSGLYCDGDDSDSDFDPVSVPTPNSDLDSNSDDANDSADSHSCSHSHSNDK